MAFIKPIHRVSVTLRRCAFLKEMQAQYRIEEIEGAVTVTATPGGAASSRDVLRAGDYVIEMLAAELNVGGTPVELRVLAPKE